MIIALQNYIETYTNAPTIVSVSYGDCEATFGTANNAMLNGLYEEADSYGFSIFVSAGDGGAAACDYPGNTTGYAVDGITVNGWASSPNVVAVGATDFGDIALNSSYAQCTDTNTYWNCQNNPELWNSAKSYIPEIAMNASCGNVLLAVHYGLSKTYGPDGFCEVGFVVGSDQYSFLNLFAGAGGPSTCAVAGPDGIGCVGYQKPDWQSGFIGIQPDGVRDIPDVSLFGGGSVWSHGYVYCNTTDGRGPPNTCVANDPATWTVGSGASFSTPIFAGIMALVQQATGGYPNGNAASTLYSLARQEYGPNGDKYCLSVHVTSTTCVFYDVSDLQNSGDSTNDVACELTNDCYVNPSPLGVLSTSDLAYDSAYISQVGWDFTSGVGTPNVANLIAAWPYP